MKEFEKKIKEERMRETKRIMKDIQNGIIDTKIYIHYNYCLIYTFKTCF